MPDQKERLFARLNYSYVLAAIIAPWKLEFRNKIFRLKLLLVPGVFFAYSAFTQHLGNYVELRKGVQLEDKLLNWFPGFDFSASIFLLLYTSIFAFIVTHLNKPRIILRVLEMHLFVAVIRQLCILMVPLEPPVGMIVLHDVFLENTVYPHHSPLTKDLFFSGHVASIWIYFLCARLKAFKIYLFFATVFMSFMVLSMHVHYTYDVYGALLFTSAIYIMNKWFAYYYARSGEQFDDLTFYKYCMAKS